MSGKRILLIIGGGIACYKCLELVRRLKERGHSVRTVMTEAATAFITPLAVSALTNERVFTDLFDVDDEREIGHIRLSRQSDVIVVAPATANLLARMAQGQASDLASATLLAADCPILVAPAMNPKMWSHPATQRHVAQIIEDGARVIGPARGEMAESGEAGVGRLVEPLDLVAEIEAVLGTAARGSGALSLPLSGQHVLVTAGPTHEPIAPVRYIANRSSGKQGYAIAAAAARAGARVTLVSGPTRLADPGGVTVRRVETAREMLAAVEAALPADVGVFTAAVADWRVAEAGAQKIKKTAGGDVPALRLVENPDILKTIAGDARLRPRLVVGFAAETENVVAFAQRKLAAKGADWIVANDVSDESGIAGGVMGGERNIVHIVSQAGVESWPEMAKGAVAEMLVTRIAEALAQRGAHD